MPESVRLLPLAGCTGRNRFALVDEDVYVWATDFNWFVNDRGYIHRNRLQDELHLGKTVRLHNLILPPAEGQVIDHINRDPLDNRRSNLRLVTPAQNAMNRGVREGRSRFRGVSGTEGHWQCKLRIANQELRLGRYSDERDAARVYDLMAALLLGDAAQLNYPRQLPHKTLFRLWQLISAR
ncbi:HNH endonuclease [Deinococcus sp.]|uniref:HNH endonuclease n=1 Tax=Deinococcus sp. TaxID=47478 RepID=UPI003C7D2EE8